MNPLDDVVTVRPLPGDGVELHATADGEGFVLRLGALAGLTLADELCRACEQHQPLRVIAA